MGFALAALARGVLLLLAGLVAAAGPARAQLDRPGPLAVESRIYNFGDEAFQPDQFLNRGVEVRGEVVYPKGLLKGPYPLIVLLHGRHAVCAPAATPAPANLFTWPCPQGARPIDSFLGYRYLANFLASHGYIVVSISANGINAVDGFVLDNGTAARGQLIDRHLTMWQTFATKGGDPFGTTFVGKVDLARVGTMGHSRGGEGVMFHYLLNKGLGSRFTIQAVLALAPVNSRRVTVAGAPIGIILPYCDGDVSDLQGVKYYDDARYAQSGDPSPKYYFLMMGANHNFYNTVWSPSTNAYGASDDWFYTANAAADPYCGKAITNKRLSEERQRKLGLVYMATFFRVHVGGEASLARYLQGVAKPLADQKDDELLVTYHAPDDKALRLDLNRLTDTASLQRNSVGGAVVAEQFRSAEMCGGDGRPRSSCLPMKELYTRDPHTTTGGPFRILLAPDAKGLNQLRLAWTNSTGRFANELPSDRSDVSGYQWLQFRAALNYADPSNQTASRGDFTVRIIDLGGKVASVRVGQYTQALSYPPGRLVHVPKVVLTTARVPLDAFKGVDLRRAKSVEFLFDATPSGEILLSDIAFVKSQ